MPGNILKSKLCSLDKSEIDQKRNREKCRARLTNFEYEYTPSLDQGLNISLVDGVTIKSVGK